MEWKGGEEVRAVIALLIATAVASIAEQRIVHLDALTVMRLAEEVGPVELGDL